MKTTRTRTALSFRAKEILHHLAETPADDGSVEMARSWLEIQLKRVRTEEQERLIGLIQEYQNNQSSRCFKKGIDAVLAILTQDQVRGSD